MRCTPVGQRLVWLSLAASATAQNLLNDLSFGHKTPFSPNGRAIPGWSLSGENHQVQLLSDRVILTPPVPGNTRGALWADGAVPTSEWTAEIEFRAFGQDLGTGNLNIWFTQDKTAVQTNSVYTVENFDGLALVIDQYGGTGGKIRGFLNDGTVNYKAHSNLESLAFGNCDYSYRNLGRPSTLRISAQRGLTVSIDDQECFRTDRVALPAGYTFGVTAAAGDNPDSFEVSKFVVSGAGGYSSPPPWPPTNEPPLQKLDRFPGSPQAVPDTSAEEIRGSDAQFTDLHNRLQGMTHQVASSFAEFASLDRKIDQQHHELLAALPAASLDTTLQEIKLKLDSLERKVQQIQRDVEGRDYREHMNDLQKTIDSIKGGLTESLPDTMRGIIASSAPQMGLFVFVVLAVQITLAGAYVFYKRRRNSMPKKYL